MEIDDPETELLRLIGRRVAHRRGELRLTLDEVADRSGVSRAMVSRIERGEVHASAVVLDRLCAGLDMTLSALFARETMAPLLRRTDQPVWRDPQSGYVRREVAPAGTGSPVRLVEIEFPPESTVDFAPYERRGVDQHIWLLDGEIEITVGGTTHHLHAGDCLHMRLDAGDTFRNVSSRTARYAVILTRDAR